MRPSLALYLQMGVLFTFLTLIIVVHYSLRGLERRPRQETWHVPVSDPERGRLALEKHGCGSCHIVPGVRNALGTVGPRLDELKLKMYVAGVLPHTPQNLVQWIQHPRSVDPDTAMPNLGVDLQEGRDIAAYLYAISEKR